jgi:hypothetical protein
VVLFLVNFGFRLSLIEVCQVRQQKSRSNGKNQNQTVKIIIVLAMVTSQKIIIAKLIIFSLF